MDELDDDCADDLVVLGAPVCPQHGLLSWQETFGDDDYCEFFCTYCSAPITIVPRVASDTRGG